MLYMMLMAGVPDAPPAVPGPPGVPHIDDWIEEMVGRDVDRGGARLRPTAEARTVRAQGGRTVVTHGPYAEVAEQVAGYSLVEAADLDEAIEIAAKHPSAHLGAVEIRPLWTE